MDFVDINIHNMGIWCSITLVIKSATCLKDNLQTLLPEYFNNNDIMGKCLEPGPSSMSLSEHAICTVTMHNAY